MEQQKLLDRLAALQAVGVFCQILNAQIGILTQSPVLALVLGAAFGAFQWYLQRIGNKTTPPGS